MKRIAAWVWDKIRVIGYACAVVFFGYDVW